MKNFLASILYFLSAALFLGLSSLIFEGSALYISIALILVSWLLVFINLHKLILVFLGAREIIDTDHQDLFQCIKFNVYSLNAKTPKVFSYSGTFKNCFILESESEWIIVLDKKLLQETSKEVLLDLVSYLFKYHQRGHGLLKTKVLGLLALYYSCLFGFFNNVLFLRPDTRSFKTLSTFFILMVRPVTLVLEKFLQRNNKVDAGENLRPLYLQCPLLKTSDVFLELHSSEYPQVGKLLVDYIESFPVIRECEFKS